MHSNVESREPFHSNKSIGGEEIAVRPTFLLAHGFLVGSAALAVRGTDLEDL